MTSFIMVSTIERKPRAPNFTLSPCRQYIQTPPVQIPVSPHPSQTILHTV